MAYNIIGGACFLEHIQSDPARDYGAVIYARRGQSAQQLTPRQLPETELFRLNALHTKTPQRTGEKRPKEIIRLSNPLLQMICILCNECLCITYLPPSDANEKKRGAIHRD